MNPHDRENAPQRLHRNPDLPPWTVFNNSTPRIDRDWETYSQYCNDRQDRIGDDLKSKGLNSPLNDSDSEDKPDGEPLDVQSAEDPELKRKLKELEDIEQRIQRKKFDIALKKVEPFVKETLAQGFPCNKQLSTTNGATLKDRVNVILQQRHSASFLSKVQSHADRMKAGRLRAEGMQQGHHPLKLRVKALMKQRSLDPAAFSRNLKVPDVTLSPPSQRTSSPAKDESNNQGFQRFVSLLNKGVDIDSLSRIVNNDHDVPPGDEELLNCPSGAVECRSELSFTHKSPRLSSGGESKCKGSSQERLSLLADNVKRNGRRDHSFTSNSRSRSPSERKKKRQEEKPHVEEQQAQLQNVLHSLGMSLEEQEINKLADRTQERLYGRRHKGVGSNSTEEQENRQHRSSSSSSTTSSSSSHSSSSSSKSTSRSGSCSPSRHRRSRSRDWKRRRKSKHKHSRDTNSLMHQDGRKEISTYHPYPQNPGYPLPNPAAFSAFPEYGLSQNSQYNAHPSGSSSWMCTSPLPLAFYPSGHPYPQNTFYPFPSLGAPSNMAYPSHSHPEDVVLPANPDQSESEGKVLVASSTHCLQQLTNQSDLKKLTKSHRSRSLDDSQRKNRNSQKKTNLPVKQEPVLVVKAEATQSCSNESEEEKQQKNMMYSFGEQVPDVASSPPSQGASSPAKRENNVNQGFQRFVSLLNKGVDIDSLSRIVNDDSQAPPGDEELLNVSSAAVANNSELPFTHKSPRLSSGSERKNKGSSQERCRSERLSLPAENEKRNDRRDHSFTSNCRSRSPSERKKKRQQEKPHVEEQQAQLQNVLHSLGMSLEEKEINKLADRTQERLYGRKHKGMENNSLEEQENRQHRSSSSSSTSSSSSRSTSRSGSRSPSRHRRSHSRDWKRKRKSKHKHSRNKSRDGPTHQDSRRDISTYQHPYPQYQMYPYSNPAAFFAFPEYGLSQNSQYNIHPSGFSSWSSTQSTNPTFYPSGLSYPPNAFYHFPGLGAASNIVYSAPTQPEEVSLPVNPDLAESEGQGSVSSGTRCLQIVQTKRLMSQKQFAENHRRKMQVESQEKNKNQVTESKEKAKTPQTFVVQSEPKESKEEKQPPTEEEIKANLRKKLEAFNQMVKQKFTQPATSLSSQTS